MWALSKSVAEGVEMSPDDDGNSFKKRRFTLELVPRGSDTEEASMPPANKKLQESRQKILDFARTYIVEGGQTYERASLEVESSSVVVPPREVAASQVGRESAKPK
jgi:hypothetical protein